jgi:hypothetical protein
MLVSRSYSTLPHRSRAAYFVVTFLMVINSPNGGHYLCPDSELAGSKPPRATCRWKETIHEGELPSENGDRGVRAPGQRLLA